MGAKCCGSSQSKDIRDIEFLEVRDQDMLMDNDEVRVMAVKDTQMVKNSKDNTDKDFFDGYLQRRSYFVIPQIDKLKKDKLELKQQLVLTKPGQ